MPRPNRISLVVQNTIAIIAMVLLLGLLFFGLGVS